VVPALKRLAGESATPGPAGVELRRLIRIELALVAVILVATGALAGSLPPKAGTGPASAETTMGPAAVEITVDPATPGPNEMHIYLTDAQTGDPFDVFKELSVSLSLPDKDLGPLKPDVREAGPGHFVVPSAPFGAPGDWTVRLEGLMSKFSEQTGEVEVPIR
jgi:copper transport protein